VNLGELALTCFAYGAMNYDDSLGQFERRVGGEVDLANEEHRMALLHLLNQSQCRQFSLAYHDLASAELLAWCREFDSTLPPRRNHLWEVPEATVEQYAAVFGCLAKKLAGYRDSTRVTGGRKDGAAQAGRDAGFAGGKQSAVSFGPTAAAKILFVLRPKVFVAWDEPMRAGLRYDGSGHSYVHFLIRLREELLELEGQCRAFDLELTDLPEALGRPLSTPAQLMDEYYWAMITRGVVAPTRQQVARWLEWYTPPEQPTMITRAPVGEPAIRQMVPPPV
jgi:hypothetical protein